MRISRRIVLRGMGGVTLALPLLESVGRAATVATPPWVAFIVSCNGVVQNLGSEPELFWPSAAGPLSKASLDKDAATRATGLFSVHAERLLVVRGVNMSFPTPTACAHTWGDNQCLTASRPAGDADGPATSLATGESLDNRLARELPAASAGPLVVHAGVNEAGGKGYGSPGFVSYAAAKQPSSVESNPWTVYQRIIGSPSTNTEAGQALARRRKSVNDLVRAQLQRILSRGDLSAADRRRIDAHVSSIRDVETAMSAAGLPDDVVADLRSVDGKDDAGRVRYLDNANRLKVARLQLSLMRWALASGYTRVAVLKLGDNNDGARYVVDGVERPSFHMISHRVLSDGGNGPPIEGAVDLHGKIVRMHAAEIVRFADDLAATSTPDGSLLSSGVAVWTNQVGNGNHDSRNLPYVCIGTAGGRLRTGAFVEAGGVPASRMLNTIRASVTRTPDSQDDFGDPSLPRGRLSSLLT